MEATLWIIALVLSLALAYMTRFANATLRLGQQLAASTAGTGVQDAITSPWHTRITLLVWSSILGDLILAWWQFGWVSALVVFLLAVPGSFVSGAILPRPEGDHFRGLILRSMCSRYANYVRDGDLIRAQAMRDLLERASVTVSGP